MATGQMMTISGGSLDIGDLPFNVHTMNRMGQLVLFARKGIPITPEVKEKIKKGGRTFYIDNRDLSVYVEYKIQKVKELASDKTVPIEIKQTMVKDVGTRILQKIHKEGFDKTSATHSKEFTDSIVNMVAGAPDSYGGLLNIASLNSYQYDHAINCSTFAIMLGMEIYGKSQKKLFLLGLGAMLMDIGMSRIDTAILEKSTDLTTKERKTIQLHTKLGYDMLKGHDLPPYVADMALHHHERMDGSGYPNSKSGDDIRMYLKICAAADVYDALTSRRPFRGPQLHMKAIEYMLEYKNKFSIEVVHALMKIVLKNDKLINVTMAKYK